MKILIKAVAGSHLFGTNGPQSDHDYKGVFLPSAEQIILGSYSDTIRQSTGNGIDRNTKDDVDCELYSLRKFLIMVENGDTAALELLFTPESHILIKDPIWDEIISIRHMLISKKINSLIGYIRQQSNKYGIKGSRMGELNNALKVLKEAEKKHEFSNPKLKHSWDELVRNLKGYEHVHLIALPIDKRQNITTPAFDILDSKFSCDTPFSVCVKSLSDKYKAYGQRAREAKNNNGIDWKAISHCLRCGIQAIELMTSNHITLPHTQPNREYLLKVKQGEFKYSEVEPQIEAILESVELAAKNSNLVERLDRKYLDSILLKYYKQEIVSSMTVFDFANLKYDK